MNDIENDEIRLSYGCAVDNGIQWKLKNNRRFSICGLQSGYMIVLGYVSGKRLFSTMTTSNAFSITISHSKSGCIIISIKDRNLNILKRSFISVS